MIHDGGSAWPIGRRLLVFGAMSAIVGVGYFFSHYHSTAQPAAPAPTPTSLIPIAILPFDVRGGEEVDVLSAGMVTLLGIRLDGAGNLRRVDTNAVLSFVRQQGRAALQADQGHAVAQHFHAGLYVLGTIVVSKDHIRIDASLYDTKRIAAAEKEVTVEGDSARLPDLVDELASGLCADRLREMNVRVAKLAAVTSPSFDALRAYLEGEAMMRGNRYREAAAAFRRALEADPLFALAHYRLSMVAAWSGESGAANEAADALQHAVLLSNRLPEHERQLLEARLADQRGLPDDAGQRYRALIASAPDDWEAWFGLGETLARNPSPSRPPSAVRGAFEQALALVPDHAAVRARLAQVVSAAGE